MKELFVECENCGSNLLKILRTQCIKRTCRYGESDTIVLANPLAYLEITESDLLLALLANKGSLATTAEGLGTTAYYLKKRMNNLYSKLNILLAQINILSDLENLQLSPLVCVICKTPLKVVRMQCTKKRCNTEFYTQFFLNPLGYLEERDCKIVLSILANQGNLSKAAEYFEITSYSLNKDIESLISKCDLLGNQLETFRDCGY
jgi:hypothetical protein